MTATLEGQAPAKTNEQITNAKYVRPKVCVGLGVIFWKEGQAGPYPATVFADSGTTVDIIYTPPGSVTMQTLYGVRHREDPTNRDVDVMNAGLWDLTEETKMIRKMMSK